MARSVLKVFVATHCSGCAEARSIAGRINRDYPQIAVEVIDINDTRNNIPDVVFATPTYMLDGRVVSLGNPAPVDIARWFSAITAV